MDNENRARFEWIALRCQSGEMSAFEDLIAVMERPLLYYATSLIGNQDGGLDVLQDVWIKVLHGIRTLKDPGSLRSWLYAITHGLRWIASAATHPGSGPSRWSLNIFRKPKNRCLQMKMPLRFTRP